MRLLKNSHQQWRILLLFPIAVFAIVSILATAHDDDDEDGGGGNGGGDTPPIILSNYNFGMRALLGDNPFTADAGGMFTVSIDFGNTLLGSINLNVDANNNVTLVSYVIGIGSSLNFTVSSANQFPLDGTFAMNVTAAMNGNVGEPPTTGAFEVATAVETVTVTVVATGVELSLNGGTPVPFTWDAFTDLLDNDMAPDWQRRASLAGGALEFIFELAFEVTDTLDELEILETTNPFVDTCDMFTGPPPQGVMAQGEVTITWLGSVEVMPGDDFQFSFTDCWDDDPTDDTDELINGSVTLDNYTEGVDANNRLVIIGFEPSQNQPGGIIFNNYTISETDENQGVFTIDPANVVTLNGGFTLIFSAP